MNRVLSVNWISRFQLTHSRGVRRHWCLPTSRTPGISTHALTWSATRRNGDRHSCTRHFNSRTHVECDDSGIFPSAISVYFNSRTHVECDRRKFDNITDNKNFNSRTHVECDHLFHCYNYTTFHFNSRTHVECDRMRTNQGHLNTISTHALTWSATFNILITPFMSKRFQLTHSRGVRL